MNLGEQHSLAEWLLSLYEEINIKSFLRNASPPVDFFLNRLAAAYVLFGIYNSEKLSADFQSAIHNYSGLKTW
jgi:hypothetical protein